MLKKIGGGCLGLIGLVVVIVVIIAVVSIAGGSDSGGGSSSNDTAGQATSDDSTPDNNSNSKPKKEAPNLTPGQENALGSAQDYLSTGSFSKKGLAEQLKFEDYNPPDIKYAVNHVKVNFMVQAEKAAKDYLDTSSFSRTGLIEQLKFDGFTPAQAAHGADSAGL